MGGVRLAMSLAVPVFILSSQGVIGGPPLRVSNNPAQSQNPALAVDPTGTSYLVWEDDRDGNWEIYFRRVDKYGIPETGEIRVTNTAGNSRYPDIDVDDDQNSRIVWQEDSAVVFCVLDPSGNKVLPDTTVASGNCSNPAIALRPDGTAHLVWEKTIITSYRVYFNQLDPSGNKLGNDIPISDRDIIGIVPKAPDIDLDPLYNSYIVWRDHYNFASGIYYCRVNADRSIYTNFPIINQDQARSPRVNISGSNYLNIVYQDSQMAGEEIYYVFNVDDGRQVSASTAEAQNSTIGGDPINREIVYTAWEDNTEGPWEIYLRRVNPTTGDMIGNPTRISDAGADSTQPDLRVVNERWYLAWQDLRDGNSEVYLDHATPLPDSDGDALPDDWENSTAGHLISGSPLPLKDMGATPDHKDVFVEVDWMNHPKVIPHLTRPNPFDRVIVAFARAPIYDNPDGTTGIRLHIDYGQDAWPEETRPSADGISRWRTGGATAISYTQPLVIDTHWTNFFAYKNEPSNFDPDRWHVFHYCLFIDQATPFSSNSGRSAGFPGASFFVSLGDPEWNGGTPQEQAGTFMHELGHNLGLDEGGCDHLSWKPNHLSVMNYSFQTRGLYKDGSAGHLSYSHVALGPLREDGGLDESDGLNGGDAIDGYGTIWFLKSPFALWGFQQGSTWNANEPINWNLNHNRVYQEIIDDEPIKANIHYGDRPPHDEDFSDLVSCDEWHRLIYTGHPSPGEAIGLGSLEKNDKATEFFDPLNFSDLTAEQDAAIAPPPPATTTITVLSDRAVINWSSLGLDIVNTYRIYRRDQTGATSLLGETSDLTYTDFIPDGSAYVYLITSVDTRGKETPLPGITPEQSAVDAWELYRDLDSSKQSW
ncbi:MAG: hypothetical protein A2951_01345 [Candidatus Buchananbacteria bacterium RIFCSPLOWO2_01_FULL_56_15]|uniref:Fibronectin type-III domain-containing protein n=2 Tax=Candidatus Buchananiibacteriota TaxID=1817903 RepID=A0A1G1YH66_9BACT|nr:MAG: hypothetical protein A3J59_01665 [Candidatus Buchananbacteria bacterium RIFCSPHIGHO2_02_FULL_56_16]OGY54605.1 MAG: hypothetical protein A2951_01345 [Candidatus Buchananbacteria bacterium RIFCSPLOWO2_01_FULL_56_15]